MHALWEILYWGWVASEVVIALVTRTRRSQGNVQDRGTQWILWLVIAVCITASEFTRDMVAAPIFGRAPWIRIAAILLMIAGLVIRWTAVISLGKAFSANVAIRESQQLRNTGLYRFVRHPSYLGLLLIFIAIGLFSRNWLSFVIAIVPPTAALLYRIYVEENALRRSFGAEYVAYSAETKRLIPGLY